MILSELDKQLKETLLNKGASLVGVGDLTMLAPEERKDMPIGVSVMVKYPEEVIKGIAELPTQEYCNWYNALNEQLDALVTTGAELLRQAGYIAFAQTREAVGFGESEDSTVLPHKTVATRAGLGWIGKSALLITPQYGSMVRLSSILTNAPLATSEAINSSKCGSCMRCTEACPAGAIKGKEWTLGVKREELLDYLACRKVAQERALQGFGGGHTICGKCIEVCPHTRKSWKN